MKILIVNDDGIHAAGIIKLAEIAKKFGDVTVVAPHIQCSGMSHRITPFGDIILNKEDDFPVFGVQAYSITGSPADCVKVGIEVVSSEMPDVVFSGINRGCNAGRDILYSGTVGGALEASLYGSLSIAFSSLGGVVFDVEEKFLPGIARDLLDQKLSRGVFWNVNFPDVHRFGDNPSILKGRIPSKKSYYDLHYRQTSREDGSTVLSLYSIKADSAEPGTDIDAVINGNISVGIVSYAFLLQE